MKECFIDDRFTEIACNGNMGKTMISKIDGCAMSQDKKLFCWGNNEDALSKTPILNDVTQISATMHHPCALAGGKVHAGATISMGKQRSPAA